MGFRVKSLWVAENWVSAGFFDTGVEASGGGGLVDLVNGLCAAAVPWYHGCGMRLPYVLARGVRGEGFA